MPKKEENNQEPAIDEQLIGAFVHAYTYTPYEFDADTIFNTAALRDFFHCWRAFGDDTPDLLQTYIERLADLGYKRIIGSEGLPIIPAIYNSRQPSQDTEEIIIP